MRLLQCSSCYGDKKYDIAGFMEHYAECHIGDFYLYTCPSCQEHFTSAFLAAHHMLTCWVPNSKVQEYARPIDDIPFCNYQILNKAVGKAVEEAIERAIEEDKQKQVIGYSPGAPDAYVPAMYPSRYNLHELPYGDSEQISSNNGLLLNTMDNNNVGSHRSWGDSPRVKIELNDEDDPNNRSSLKEYGYQRDGRRSPSLRIAPRRFREDRDGRRRSRSRERTPARRDRSPLRRDRSPRRRDRSPLLRDRSPLHRERSPRRRRNRPRRGRMSPDRSRQKNSSPNVTRSDHSYSTTSVPSNTSIAAPIPDRRSIPSLFDVDVSAYIANPAAIPLPTYNKAPTIVQIGKGVSKLTGVMSTRSMNLFNTKNDLMTLNIEIQSSKGATQMFFNPEILRNASPYFARIFASPEFRESNEKKLPLHRPEVPFIDAMNYLYEKKVPWKTRCRGGYFIVENLHRAYKVLCEARFLELQDVRNMAAKDLFLNRCNLANEVVDCTGCIERAVLALHFDIPVPDTIKYSPLACLKWMTDCEERSCAPELEMTDKVLQFLKEKKFLPALPGING